MHKSDRRILPNERLASLDAFRGMTMLLLISGSFGLETLAHNPTFGFIGRQFIHHQWNGLYFWDLIQPMFMFIVGVAMPFSFGRRWEQGETWAESLRHVLRRSATLFLFGVMLHCWYSRAYVWELWNVLTQLSVTYLVAFLFMRKSIRTQIIITFAILVANYLLYRFPPVSGITEYWAKDQNFGSDMDRVLMGKINNGGGWVAINVIGSSAHTMWGVIAGLVLRSDRDGMAKVRHLVIAGIAGVFLGYALNPVTPIIKRICTSSFILASGGYALIALGLFYWIIDVQGHKKWVWIVAVTGMNAIFIYLFHEVLGGWAREFVGVFIGPITSRAEIMGPILHANAVLAFYWYLCWWLYKRKIFIRI